MKKLFVAGLLFLSTAAFCADAKLTKITENHYRMDLKFDNDEDFKSLITEIAKRVKKVEGKYFIIDTANGSDNPFGKKQNRCWFDVYIYKWDEDLAEKTSLSLNSPLYNVDFILD